MGKHPVGGSCPDGLGHAITSLLCLLFSDWIMIDGERKLSPGRAGRAYGGTSQT